MSEILLTKKNFNEEVLISEIPILVDFSASWCGPCQIMNPIIKRLAEDSDGSYKVGKVDIDREPELTVRYHVMSVPTFMVFKNGEVVSSATGFRSTHELLDMIYEEKSMRTTAYVG